jgi:hypothetical protein
VYPTTIIYSFGGCHWPTNQQKSLNRLLLRSHLIIKCGHELGLTQKHLSLPPHLLFSITPNFSRLLLPQLFPMNSLLLFFFFVAMLAELVMSLAIPRSIKHASIEAFSFSSSYVVTPELALYSVFISGQTSSVTGPSVVAPPSIASLFRSYPLLHRGGVCHGGCPQREGCFPHQSVPSYPQYVLSPSVLLSHLTDMIHRGSLSPIDTTLRNAIRRLSLFLSHSSNVTNAASRVASARRVTTRRGGVAYPMSTLRSSLWYQPQGSHRDTSIV